MMVFKLRREAAINSYLEAEKVGDAENNWPRIQEPGARHQTPDAETRRHHASDVTGFGRGGNLEGVNG